MTAQLGVKPKLRDADQVLMNRTISWIELVATVGSEA